MDFILNEAQEEDQFVLQFSDGATDEMTNEDAAFVDDAPIEQESISFYRDPSVLENYPRFRNQTRNPIDVINEEIEDYFGNDNQPELYEPEVRDNVEFDFSNDYKKAAEKFKKTLVCFSDVENHLFYAVIYELMFKKTENGQIIRKENAREVLGGGLFFDLKETEAESMLDHSLFGYFNRCFAINTVLGKHGYFLRFFERKNQFRYQIRKKLKSKNEMRRELSTCAIRKFNGYELLRKDLERKKFRPLIPIYIVYEPIIDLKKNKNSLLLLPTNTLGFRTGVEKFRKEEKYMHHAGARQCHYCNNYFVKKQRKNESSFVCLRSKSWRDIFV